MKLQFLETEYSVCQLPPDRPIPSWAGNFLSASRTDDELTIIAPGSDVPADTKAETGFQCFRVLGKLEFDVIGVIAKISSALAEQKIPLLSISTYNTDYFLIQLSHRDAATEALRNSGYEFVE